MFTQKARATIAWLLAMVACIACMGMTAIAEESESGAHVQTLSEQEIVLPEDPGGEVADVQIEETPIYRVTFYDLFGEVVGWADVPEGAYLLELDGYPHVEGLVFRYWFDPSLEEVVPYVFGSSIYSGIDLVPFYTLAPGAEQATEGPLQGDAIVQTPVYPEPVDEQQVAQMVEQILSTEVTAGSEGEGAPQTVADPIDKEALASGILNAIPEDEVSTQPHETSTNVGEDTLFYLLDEAVISEAVISTQDGDVQEALLPGEGDLLGDDAAISAESILNAGTVTQDENETETTEATDALQTEGAEEAQEPVNLLEGLLTGSTDELAVDPEAIVGDEAVTPEATDEVAPQPEEMLEATEVSEPSGNNMVLVLCSFEGDSITYGSPVTLSAELINFPEDAEVTYQWQNNANGAFEDIPGATERSYTFIADEQNVRCSWQVRTRY